MILLLLLLEISSRKFDSDRKWTMERDVFGVMNTSNLWKNATKLVNMEW